MSLEAIANLNACMDSVDALLAGPDRRPMGGAVVLPGLGRAGCRHAPGSRRAHADRR